MDLIRGFPAALVKDEGSPVREHVPGLINARDGPTQAGNVLQ